MIPECGGDWKLEMIIRRAGCQEKKTVVERLEARTMFSESATAQLSLVSTEHTPQNTIYNYDIDVVNTGSTSIGTFWFAWKPGEDLLPSAPVTVTSPTGWNDVVTGAGDSTDGSAIQWEAGSHPIAVESSVDGFAFSTLSSPAELAGDSPTHAAEPVLTSFVYAGAPLASGDNGYSFSVSPVVADTTTVTTLMSSALTAVSGTAVSFTAAVVPGSGTGSTPTGSVTFLSDNTLIGTGAVQADGTATFTTAALALGTHDITAQYSGDGTYSDSTSAAVVETITTATSTSAVATTTTLSTPTSAAMLNSTVILDASVAASTSGTTPTGTFTFSENGVSLGTAPVQSDGTATFNAAGLPIGANSIVVTYGGDANYAASVSSPVVVTIISPVAAAVSVSIGKISVPARIVSSVAAKGTATLTLTNQSTDPVKGKSTLAIYASTDGNLDVSAVLVASVVKKLNIKSGQSVSTTVPVKLPAGTLIPGTYSLLASVTSGAVNIGESSADGMLTVVAPVIALSETVVRNTIPAFFTQGKKSNASVLLNVINGGNITTGKTTTVAVYATPAGVVDSGAILLGSVSKALRIAAGKSTRVTVPGKLLSAAPTGEYEIVGQVTDPDGAVSSVVVGDVSISN